MKIQESLGSLQRQIRKLKAERAKYEQFLEGVSETNPTVNKQLRILNNHIREIELKIQNLFNT